MIKFDQVYISNSVNSFEIEYLINYFHFVFRILTQNVKYFLRSRYKQNKKSDFRLLFPAGAMADGTFD